jgi:hypothetical protein
MDEDRLESDVADILLANSAFYRSSPDDEALYLIDPATLAALAYKILQVAAVVFGATIPPIKGASWLYRKYVSKDVAQPDDPARTAVPRELPRTELRANLERLKANAQDVEINQQLNEGLEQILAYHGWPAAEARADAQRIAAVLTQGEHA